MREHYLACAYRGFGCSDGHISIGLIVVCLGILLACGAIAEVMKRKPARPVADISPFTASLLGANGERSYFPGGVTAMTPGGIKVQVRCPHLTGHRSPELAVACAGREKERIELTGR